MDVLQETDAATLRLAPHLTPTPLVVSEHLSSVLGSPAYYKCENLQPTRSFKVRGALNKILALGAEALAGGVVAASTGNHGAAVAWASRLRHTQATVFVPEGSSPAKLAKIEQLGATVRFHGTDSVAAEAHARGWAQQHAAHYISPYNDPQVIGGQGTIGSELATAEVPFDAVILALGGGGLASGVGGVLKARSPATEIIACSPVASRVMIESVRAGRLLDLESGPTLSDGTAGGVEGDALTFPLVQRFVDTFITVEEKEIRQALIDVLERDRLLVEGSAAMAAAACRAVSTRLAGRTVCVVLCGANIGASTLNQVLAAGP